MIECERYRLVDPDALVTPAMLLFEELVDHNIRTVCKLADGADNLFTHAKTHKSEAVTRKQIGMGIDSFKCATLKELEMLLQAGARRAILTCPQSQALKIEGLLDFVANFPDRWIATIASAPAHIEMLGDRVTRRNQRLSIMLDLNAGMHRTGIEIGGDAMRLYRVIDEHPFLEAAGLHCYDGHDTLTDEGRRAAAAHRHIESLQTFRRQIESAGMAAALVVAGGAYSFRYYARTEGMHGSPGSFIYWDARCRTDLPDMPFRNAALILTQVVDRHPNRGTITTDLGLKYICTDQPMEKRARLVGYEAAELVLHNEEYGVFRIPGDLPDIGAYLLAVPWHIGPTTILYPGSHVIDAAGNIVDYYEHAARDRT